MKILMIGLGSIGQRHLRNIKRLYGDMHEISAYRVRRLQQTFSDEMKIRDGVNLEEEFGIEVFTDLDEALKNKPDVVFVTNITSKHIECALKAARAGADIFLEKPMSNNMQGISELIDIAKKNKLVTYVGFQNRFHPCIMYMKIILEENAIGDIINVTSEFSERLATMHTYEDYRGTYMAKKEMGGGPILNLQIHAFDYLQWLFGEPESVYTIAKKNSMLDVDVEDSASSLFTFKSKNNKIIPVYMYTDFLQYPPVHRLKVVGSKGRAEIDLLANESTLIVDGNVISRKKYDDFTRNDMFIDELKIFFSAIEKRVQPSLGFEEAITSMKMAMAAKKSASEACVVRLEDIKCE